MSSGADVCCSSAHTVDCFSHACSPVTDLEGPVGRALQAAPRFPCVSLRVGCPPRSWCPFLAQQQPVWLAPPRHPVSVLHRCTRCPRSVTGTQAVCRGRHGGHPSKDGDTGSCSHRASTAPCAAAAGRGSHVVTPGPSLQNVTPPAWAARGRAPPSVGSVSPATARTAASVKVSGCVSAPPGGLPGGHAPAVPAPTPLPVPCQTAAWGSC